MLFERKIKKVTVQNKMISKIRSILLVEIYIVLYLSFNGQIQMIQHKIS